MGLYTSNATYTCISCRFSAKATYVCPYCHTPMTYMGKAFKPPRKTNDSQWRKVELLVEHDIRFGYCKCHRDSGKIKSLSDAKSKCKTRKVNKRNYAKVSDVRAEQIRRRKVWKAKLYD
jgi:hypothetical protein